MDVIKKDKDKQVSHILIQDHIPNRAFINEFQTNFFTLKLQSIEIVESCLQGYQVEEGGVFLVLHVMIRNNTNEILDIYKEDFALYYDETEPYPPEENFQVPFQFPDEFSLKPLEECKGSYIFIISKNAKKICFFHHEYYDEEDFKMYRLRYRLG